MVIWLKEGANCEVGTLELAQSFCNNWYQPQHTIMCPSLLVRGDVY